MFMLHKCACVHVAYMILCSCCVRALVFMLRMCTCVHVAYVHACSCCFPHLFATDPQNHHFRNPHTECGLGTDFCKKNPAILVYLRAGL